MGCSEKAAFRCEVAKRLEDAGDYEGAGEILAEVWDGPGTVPRLDGLDEKAGRLVLLRAGFLAYRVGVIRLNRGLFDEAKNLLSQAQRLSAASRDVEREAEAVNGLAQCVWRLGDCDTARMLLRDLMAKLAGADSEQLCYAAVILANVEWTDERYEAATEILSSHARLLGDGRSHALRARFHAASGQALHLAGRVEEALIEHAGASYHFEQAGDLRQSARMDNNIGCALATAGRHADAAECFARAREKFEAAGDQYGVAGVNDSEAQSCIAQRLYGRAEELAERASSAFDGSDHAAAQVEALTTYGKVLCRTGRVGEACARFERAHELALDRLGSESAGRVKDVYREEVTVALLSEPGMNYHESRRTVERALIRRAMLENGGNQTEAAFSLGMRQQALNYLLRGTHRDILDELEGRRLPPRSRVTTK
jgi:tetratricopeptide (TPR) repeat protein